MKAILAILPLLLLISCSARYSRTNPIPEEIHKKTEVFSTPYIRNWGDVTPISYYEGEYSDSSIVMKMTYQFQNWKNKDLAFLALSGGGANGAYGAGFLNGWSETGNRPEFTIVTGVSTGALIAPFAFLGSDYDSLIKEFFTSYTTDDLLERRPLGKALTSDAIMDTDGLKEKIHLYMTREVMEKIAEESKKGRVLLVGTTDMDALRPVIWNIGRIASVGTDESLNLIRDIILASASIPVAFPPVTIEVDVNGEEYEELHSDGGVTQQVFLIPSETNWKLISEALDLKSQPKLYIIRNDRLDPEWKYTPSRVGDIAVKSILSMIRTQTLGDLYRLYLLSQENGFDYNLTYVPGSFSVEAKELFDREYMKALFDVGYQEAMKENTWCSIPPELTGHERVGK